MHFVEADEETIEQLHTRIQLHVMPRRIRCKEFFNDFDRLRCGRCNVINFHRALDMIGISFSEEEVDAITHYYTESGPQVQPPQVVNYREFCAKVDEVFACDEMKETIRSGTMTSMLMSSPSAAVTSTFMPNTLAPEDEERFQFVLLRFAALCQARGVSIKLLLLDLDRSVAPNPSRQNPRRGGKVTKAQFLRNFPFKKEMSPDDIELLCEKYTTKLGDIHFMALHNDVTEARPNPEQPFPTSPLVKRPDGTKWSHHELPVVQKIMSKVVEKRCRLREHFRDFDPLRRGFCSPGQVKTVFTIMNISREIDKVDFEAVLQLYMTDEGLFHYDLFCKDIDIAFTTPNLEREPLTRLEMPDQSTTMPARRNMMKISDTRKEKVRKMEEKLRTFVRKRRFEMKPFFTDFDRAKRGYVTRNQFVRIMSMMQYDLDDKQVGLLCAQYCDFGNHNDFNYLKFIKSIDPPHEDVERAMFEMTSPHIEIKPKYFDERGRVLRKTASAPFL